MADHAGERSSRVFPDEIDRKIIRASQEGLPLVKQPYAELADKLSINEDELLSRMKHMLAAGAIRRIAAVPNHYKLGYTANGMTVWDIPDEQAKTAGRTLATLDYVSHCYLRPRHLPDWPFNLFAMIHGKEKSTVEAHYNEIQKLLADVCQQHDIIYSQRILKKTGLRIS